MTHLPFAVGFGREVLRLFWTLFDSQFVNFLIILVRVISLRWTKNIAVFTRKTSKGRLSLKIFCLDILILKTPRIGLLVGCFASFEKSGDFKNTAVDFVF